MINYRDEQSVDFKEDDQTIILQLLEHIGKKDEGSLMDYILDFCESNSYHIEDVAYLIKDNKNIKNLLKEDCIFNGILRTKKTTETERVEEW